jgi:hypothetical protein
MRGSRAVEEIDLRARLRQVEEHVPRRADVARLVPAPRRVPVFLRCHPEQGGFAELTITHPVVDTARRTPTA